MVENSRIRFDYSRKYRSAIGISTKMIDILPDNLRLRSALPPVMWYGERSTSSDTIFEEIALLDFDVANSHAEKQLKPLERIKPQIVSEADYAHIIWRTFRKTMAELWEPDKMHCVFVSSGYDSRLMAYTIMSLYQEYGSNWLGNILFIEGNGESECYRASMEAIGWPADKVFVYNEGAPANEYHKRSLDFASAWQKNEDLMGTCSSFSWEALKWLQERRLVEQVLENTQIFSGYFSNSLVLALSHRQTIYEKFKSLYYQHIANRLLTAGGSSLRPFMHLAVISDVIKYGTEHLTSGKGTGISHTVLAYCAPDKVAIVPNLLATSAHVKNIPSFIISNSLLNQAVADYRSSWLGKLFPDITPTRHIRKDRWWAYWCTASLCEHLIMKGHHICRELV